MKKIFSSVLMAVALLVSANMQAANVAKIGTTEYATLQAAFTAATNGQTITLLDSVRGEGAITINKPSATITLDMNGKTWVLCYNSSCWTQGIILEAGNLVVKGFGAIEYDSEYGSACLFKTSAGTKLTINNGNYSNSGSEPEIECGGELNIKNAWVKNISFTSTATKGTINGAHVSGQISLPSTNGITLDVLAGEINSIATMNGNIKGSTVNVKGGSITYLSNGGTNNIEAGTITNIIGGDNVITGGTLDTLYYHNSTDPYAQTQYREATYVIKGGNYATINYVTDGAARTLNQDCAEGFSLKPTGDPNHPYAASSDYIKIVETNVVYGTLEEAFAAVADGQTIKLLNDIELNGNMNLTLTGKTVTLDLNDKTWKLNDDVQAQVLGMRVYAGNIIVKDGSIIYDAPLSSCTFFDMSAGTKLTVENVTMSSTNTGTALKSNGEVVINGGEMASISLGDKATALTINDGTISSQISLPSNPENTVEVEINGGTIENICTMNETIRGTHVTVNGGNIIWLQNADSTIINDGRITNINGGFIVIQSGKFTDLYYDNNPEDSTYYRASTYTINGGVFAHDTYKTEDQSARKIEINVPADQEVIPNDDPATQAAYPWKLGVNPYKFYRQVDKGNWGTVCYEKKVTRVTNAKLYEFVARNSAKTQVMVQEVAVDTITLGRPYLFNALNDEDQIFAYDNNVPATAGSYNGLIGKLVNYTTTEDAWVVKGTSIIPAKAGSTVPQFRAYVDVDAIAENDQVFTDQASAPKRGRMIFNLSNTTTEIENVNANANANGKMMINGQLVIVKDGKMFNAQGAQL